MQLYLLPTGIVQLDIADRLCCVAGVIVIGCKVVRVTVAGGRPEKEKKTRERERILEMKEIRVRV